MKKLLFALIFGTLFSTNIFSQDNLLFENRLRGATNYFDLMEIVNAEYAALPEEIKSQGGNGYAKEKFLRRWEWWASSHLGENGTFVNVNRKTLEGIKQMNSMARIEKTTNSSWLQVGPSSSSYQNSNPYCIYNGLGRIDRIAFHPSSANTIFVGTPAGGIWKTDDGGSSWTSLNQYTPSLGVSGIVLDHSNPDIIYALTGDGDSNITNGLVLGMDYIRASVGVMKSYDGGLTWELMAELSTNVYYGYQLVMDPNDSDVLLAATTDGLWKTINGGDHWTEVLSGTVYDVAFKPGDSDQVYCTTANNIKYSIDGGDNWFDATVANAPVSGRKTISVSEDNPNAVYVLCGSNTTLANNTFAGLYRSGNSGVNFVRQSNSPNILDNTESGSGNANASNYILGVAVKHSDEDVIASCSLISFKSTDKGVTWNNSTTFAEDGGSWYVHPDLHDIEFNPLDDKLYLVGDGGISVSSDDGDTWTDITNNINTNQTYHLDQYSGSGKLLTGNQDNGLKYRFSGGDFRHVQSGDGFNPVFYPTDSTKYYSSVNDRLYRFSSSGSSRSSDLAPNGLFFKTVEVHNTDITMVLCGSTTIFKSGSSGSGFVDKGGSGSWALTACPSNNDKFYATGFSGFLPNANGKAYVSTDIGETWNDLSGNPGFPSNVWKLTDISPRPNNSSQVWMTCGGYINGSKVYYSSNSGTTWTNRSGSLPNVPVHCVAITDNNDAYIGTDIGVFYRSSTMTDWIPYSNDLPNVPVTDIRLDHNIGNGNIYIGTFGRGVWWDNISDNTCETDININTDFDGYYYYEASNSIESTSEINGSIGNEVYMSAGQSVTLKPGFRAYEKSKYKAYIAPCGDGVPSAQHDTEMENKNLINEYNPDRLVNNSRFNITASNIDCYIMQRGDYSFRLLDANYQHVSTLTTFKSGKGNMSLPRSMISSISQNTVAYIGLYEGESLLFLQELQI